MKPGWTEVALLEACRDVSGGNPKVPKSRWLSSGQLPIVDQGDSVVAAYTDESSMAFTGEVPVIIFGDHTRRLKYVDFPFAVGADGVKVLRPAQGVDARYLYHCLRSTPVPSAGYSRHFKYLKETRVPVPPRDEQGRIVAILDAAGRLRADRQATLALLVLARSGIFRSMFGSPASNDRGFAMRALGSLATKFADGPFGSNLKSADYVDAGVRVVRLQNIGVNEFNGRDEAFISEEHFSRLRKHECVPGDVLIATLGDPNVRACRLPPTVERAVNKADCVQMRVDERQAHPDFVVGLLNDPALVTQAAAFSTGQTRTRVSMGRLRTMQVPIPDLDAQREYARGVAGIHATERRAERHLAHLDALFASLQHRAFNGEL